jgi:prolyl 4-hydroxylase
MYSQNLLRWLAVMAVGMEVASAGDGAAQKKLNDFDCTHPPYKSHLLSKSPLVIYIENFVTDAERLHLQELAYVKSCLAWLPD